MLRNLFLASIVCLFIIASVSLMGKQSMASVSNKNEVEAGRFNCHIAYRSSQKKSIEMEQDAILDRNKSSKIVQGDFKITIAFIDEASDSPSVSIHVLQKGTGKVLSHNLYQFNSIAEINNNFGTHGFTGLNYVYLPNTTEELQYFCSRIN